MKCFCSFFPPFILFFFFHSASERITTIVIYIPQRVNQFIMFSSFILKMIYYKPFGCKTFLENYRYNSLQEIWCYKIVILLQLTRQGEIHYRNFRLVVKNPLYTRTHVCKSVSNSAVITIICYDPFNILTYVMSC